MTFHPSYPLFNHLIHSCGGTAEAQELIDAINGSGGGIGTVTSVGLALPAQFVITGSPVTTAGTLTGSLSAPIILADGSQAFTANESLGGNKLTNVADPTAAQDAATKNYVDTHSSSFAIGSAISGAVPYEMLCADGAGNLAQDAILRYQNSFTIHSDTGVQPLVSQINDGDFTFSFMAAVP